MAQDAAGLDDELTGTPAGSFRRVVAGNWQPAAVLVFLVLIALAALGVVYRHDLNWGDIPTWLLAATTLLAFAAAAFAGVVAYDLLRIENARDSRAAAERHERAEAERRTQANQVAAWYRVRLAQTIINGVQSGPGWPVREAVIRNASDLPVYDARVSFSVPLPASSGLHWTSGVRFTGDGIGVVPPGEDRAELPDHIREREPADEDAPKWRVAVEFTDAAGVRWLRDPHGRLEPV